MRLAVDAGRVTDVRPLASHPVSRGQLCAKGWNAAAFLHDRDRLTTPLLRRNARLEPVGWDAALDAVADAIRSAQRDGGPDAARARRTRTHSP
jgi:anaerobic selenocysteine-containing dehydrogenase